MIPLIYASRLWRRVLTPIVDNTMVIDSDKPWRNYEREYEGMPHFLRRPDFINLEEIEHRLPVLVVATHLLNSVTSSGLPESTYNKSLADFDHDLVNYCASSKGGEIVLVETFSGKRA